MENAERFFDRYGIYSVALCRFVPVLRSTVPLVAGMAGMRQRRFVMANVASAFVWAPVHIYPAQLAGLSLEPAAGRRLAVRRPVGRHPAGRLRRRLGVHRACHRARGDRSPRVAEAEAARFSRR